MRSRPPASARRGAGNADTFHSRVYAVVRRVPRGRVVTYGQVARALGLFRGARAVGWALRALPAPLHDRVPWHRVVSAGGRIAARAGGGARRQAARLRAEGVRVSGEGVVDLRRHGLLA